ncbi:transposase [Hymenobacter sp. BT188]|uniref:integrase core domain-containing protein n=1 Tax=Hymenobacter sp. BT188 TaxID=2763504 RepID=UPI001651633C|nr:integrase core domain-containing protein [Hymenobacter sp. BT188]MBC6608792.1 transposase [Hymenobacter sp. BT188]
MQDAAIRAETLRLASESRSTQVLLDRAAFASVGEAQVVLATYFDYCNHQRRHAALGYKCPHMFEQQALLTNTPLCLT